VWQTKDIWLVKSIFFQFDFKSGKINAQSGFSCSVPPPHPDIPPALLSREAA
jgi:hypothetical protein